MCLNLREGELTIRLPDGRMLAFGEPDHGLKAHVEVRNPRFALRVLRSGDIGFAEGYMAGEWDTPDLSALLTLFSANLERVVKLLRGNPIARVSNWLTHLRRENTRDGARRNILSHYDLGNRFYEAWLDPTMTYSSALFDKPGASLSEAQLAKYRAICRRIDLKQGETVLEIGCGWGGFAEVAAGEFGARVTGLTLSDEQLAFASARMQRAGLSEAVEIRLQDYRDVQGPFDKIASIEMFEAVGEKYWPAYFGKLAETLKPGGRAGLQIITIRDDLFASYSSRVDFIQRYVFPGGMLPSVERLKDETARARLSWREVEGFGLDYAETLAAWGERFRAAWSQIRPLGFDERFKRLWQFYLSYCEAGFRTGRTDVVQLSLVKS
jgi:cyclopropane-fatty-acyl-phospholipid synthase